MNEIEFLDSIKQMPLMKLPVRTTVVNLQSAQLMISPGSKLSEGDLKRYPNVTDIVAPSLFHWAGVPKAVSVLPKARVWGTEQALVQHRDVKWSNLLTPAKWLYDDELPMVQLKGIPKIDEVVFLHKKSKTIIVTDLCFNILNPKGLGAWLILNWFGTYQRFGVSKFFVRFVKDEEAFEKSLHEVLSLDFENIVLGHGANVIGGAKDKLRAALRERGYFL